MANTYVEVVTVRSYSFAAGDVRLLTPAADGRLADAELDLLLEQAALVADERNPIGLRVKAARRLAGRVPELVDTIRELRRQLHRGVLR
ncbi:MAG: hypothetical protein ACRDZ4_08525 [Egibacteraceae bacterium]